MRHEIMFSGEEQIFWNDDEEGSAKLLVGYGDHFSDKTAGTINVIAPVVHLLDAVLLNCSTIF